MNKDINQSYLEDVLELHKTHDFQVQKIEAQFKSLLAKWGGPFLHDIVRMGSFSHGTAIHKDSDVDVDYLVSIQNWANKTPKEVFESLVKFLTKEGYKPFIRNISMRIKYKGMNVDFAPGVKHPGNTDFHDVYSSKLDRALPSNPKLHTQIVKSSGRTNEIKLMKIWAQNHSLKLDGLYISLVVVDALQGEPLNELSNNFLKVLRFIESRLLYNKYVDPANHNDTISDNLTEEEKKAIVEQARDSLSKNSLSDIIK